MRGVILIGALNYHDHQIRSRLAEIALQTLVVRIFRGALPVMQMKHDACVAPLHLLGDEQAVLQAFDPIADMHVWGHSPQTEFFRIVGQLA